MNHLTISTTPRFFTPTLAEKIARDMAASDEDGWTYSVVQAEGAALAKVEVRDETGEIVGHA